PRTDQQCALCGGIVEKGYVRDSQTRLIYCDTQCLANAIAAGASDLAMVDIMKIGGVTGWHSAMAQAEAAALPLSNHTFVEPSAHVMAVSPMASWFEYLDIAGAVLTERLLPVDGTVTARGPGLGLDWDEHAVARRAFS
ncbi:MAG: hypothetical protein J2P54_25360, partial [Bradyrhizobiaceae bacterium]|nr:hypothetical protein [Bradyrhizobiaceae bacterium]